MLDYYRFKEIQDLFMKGNVEEARHMLVDMQSRYVALCDENTLLKMQVQEFEDILYLSRNLVFDGFCYWLITGGIKQGPFCQCCYNRDGVLSRMATRGAAWLCASCGAEHAREPRYAMPAPGFDPDAMPAPGRTAGSTVLANLADMASQAANPGRGPALETAAPPPGAHGAQSMRSARTGKLLQFVK